MSDAKEIRAIRVPDGSVIVDGAAFDVLTGIADLYAQLIEDVDDMRAREAEAERLIRHIRNEKRPTVGRIIEWQNDADRWLDRRTGPDAGDSK